MILFISTEVRNVLNCTSLSLKVQEKEVRWK